ncbi:hypothetical protein [Polyangium mundeleinium]|uniref:Uncharacterized protein n=1 Tax=Polyangium mundeleinium TaxID=2995306 RepID=A0ABT5ERY8_9BACT|nr:hypothetical protein [Polyangium mundeleinium]MDC0744572.1 hypothetical protein [Polyangium mundeleinium]
MTTPASNDLLARLRAAEELYAEVTPDPTLEARLGARLRSLGAKPPRVVGSTSLRGLARPLALVTTCALVLFLSLDDDTPHARSGLVSPKQTEFAADPDVAPAADRAPETNPRVLGPPRAPVPSAPDARPHAPSPSWRALDPSSPFDADPERRPIELDGRGPRRDVPSGPRSRMHSPGGSGDVDGSEGLVFWSPTQALAGESGAPATGSLGGARGATTNMPKPPVDPAGPQASCATPETWKERAELDCDENGLILAEITYLDACGDGLFRSAEHECAEPDPEVDVCTIDTVGDGVTCQDPSKLKDIASQVCQIAGQQMVDFQYTTGDCGWMTRQASYTCCPPIVDPPPPPPPPLVCQSGALGDGVTCLDKGLLKDKAYAACNALGLSLADLQTAGDCPADQASKVGFSCCEP